MASYSKDFKEQIVRKMMPPNRRSAASISRESGVPNRSKDRRGNARAIGSTVHGYSNKHLTIVAGVNKAGITGLSR